MLHLILADAELETVPAEIASNRIITWQARRRKRWPTEILRLYESAFDIKNIRFGR